MKLFLSVLLCISFLCNAQTIAWKNKSDLPAEGRDDAIAFAINGYGYCGTGNTFGWSGSNRFFKYDSEKDTWIEVASFPGVSRQYTNVFVINSKAYLICGALTTNEVTQEVWCYDSKEDIWVQKNNFPAAARCGAYSFTINQHGYFGCGQGVERYSDFWKYDPTDDHWERIADFPDGGRREGISFSCGGFGFAGLGVTTFDDAGHTDEIYKYNPLTNEWTSITPYPGGATSYAKAESFDVFAIVGGGQEGLLNFQSDFYMYDVLEDSWIQLEDYPEGGIRGAASFAIGNTVYFCTGLREDIIKTKSLYSLSVSISVSETKWQQSIRLFPNPSFGQIIITGKDWNTSTTLKIFNTEGKIVYNSIVYQGTINLNYLNSGAYILQLEREDGTVFSKKLHLF